MGKIGNRIADIVANFGELISKTSKNKTNAIILVVVAAVSPLGFIFAASMIAYFYKKNKKKR